MSHGISIQRRKEYIMGRMPDGFQKFDLLLLPYEQETGGRICGDLTTRGLTHQRAKETCGEKENHSMSMARELSERTYED